MELQCDTITFCNIHYVHFLYLQVIANSFHRILTIYSHVCMSSQTWHPYDRGWKKRSHWRRRNLATSPTSIMTNSHSLLFVQFWLENIPAWHLGGKTPTMTSTSRDRKSGGLVQTSPSENIPALISILTALEISAMCESKHSSYNLEYQMWLPVVTAMSPSAHRSYWCKPWPAFLPWIELNIQPI